MSAVTDEFHKLVTQLEAEGHALADKFRALFGKLKGDETTLATDARTDEMQIAQDAKPVVAEAETDAKALATEAVTDVKDATSPAPEPPAAA